MIERDRERHREMRVRELFLFSRASEVTFSVTNHVQKAFNKLVFERTGCRMYFVIYIKATRTQPRDVTSCNPPNTRGWSKVIKSYIPDKKSYLHYKA